MRSGIVTLETGAVELFDSPEALRIGMDRPLDGLGVIKEVPDWYPEHGTFDVETFSFAAGIEVARREALARIDAAVNAGLANGFDTSIGKVQSDTVSQLRILTLTTMANSALLTSTPLTITFIKTDNTTVDMTPLQMVQFSGELTLIASALVTHGRGLKNQILAAGTIEAIEAVQWSAPQISSGGTDAVVQSQL